METIALSKQIEASREIIWEAIVDPDLYRQWTEAFTPGSDFEGSWIKGSRIVFYAPDEEGRHHGMVSEIAENRYPEFISVRHVGILTDDVEDRDSEMAKRWSPAYENYTLDRLDENQSLFILNMEVDPSQKDEFVEMWEEALLRLAALCESLVGTRMSICLRQEVRQTPEHIWEALTNPEHVKGWNFADASWHCPSATNSLQPGGEFHYVMAARDGSTDFDFWGTYATIHPYERLEMVLGDGRPVEIRIIPKPDGALVEERFAPEQTNNLDLQRQGWAAILKRLATYCEERF